MPLHVRLLSRARWSGPPHLLLVIVCLVAVNPGATADRLVEGSCGEGVDCDFATASSRYMVSVRGFGRTGTSFLQSMLDLTARAAGTMSGQQQTRPGPKRRRCTGEGQHNQDWYPGARNIARLHMCRTGLHDPTQTMSASTVLETEGVISETSHPELPQRALTCPRGAAVFAAHASKIWQDWQYCFETPERHRILVEKTPDFFIAGNDAAWGHTGRLMFFVVMRHPLKELFVFRQHISLLLQLWQRAHSYVLWAAQQMHAPVVYVRFEDLTMHAHTLPQFLWDVAHSSECGWPQQPTTNLIHDTAWRSSAPKARAGRLRRTRRALMRTETEAAIGPGEKQWHRKLPLRAGGQLDNEEASPKFLISAFMKGAAASCNASAECRAMASSPRIRALAQNFFYGDDVLDLTTSVGQGENSVIRAYCARDGKWLTPDKLHVPYASGAASSSTASTVP